jgi:hypothetical protein
MYNRYNSGKQSLNILSCIRFTMLRMIRTQLYVLVVLEKNDRSP